VVAKPLALYFMAPRITLPTLNHTLAGAKFADTAFGAMQKLCTSGGGGVFTALEAKRIGFGQGVSRIGPVSSHHERYYPERRQESCLWLHCR
jgi:hypothetical protein